MRYVDIRSNTVLEFPDDNSAREFHEGFRKKMGYTYCVVVNIDTNERIDIVPDKRVQWLADDNYTDYLETYVVGRFNLLLVSNFKVEKDGKVFLVSFDYEGENYHCHTDNADAYYTVFGKYANKRTEEYFEARKDLIVELAENKGLI